MNTIREKLDKLLAAGHITKDQYDELVAAIGSDGEEPVAPVPLTTPQEQEKAALQPEAPASPEVPERQGDAPQQQPETTVRHLNVRLIAEDLRIRGGTGLAAVRVVKGASYVTVRQEGENVVIESTVSADPSLVFGHAFLGIGRERYIAIDIEVPADIACEIKTVSGDVQLYDLTGPVEVRTVSGDVTARNLSRIAAMILTSGDVELEQCFLDGGEVISKSGDIDVRSSTIHGLLKSYSGDLDIQGSTLNDTDITSFSGDVDLDDVTVQAAARLHTTSGDIGMTLNQHDILADIETRSGDATIRGPGTDIRTQRQRIPIGQATVPITVRTGSGDIDINLR